MTDRLLTAAEVAEILGFSPATIVDWAQAGTIPAFKVGGRLRFSETEVLDWLDDRRMQAADAGGEAPATPSERPPARILDGRVFTAGRDKVRDASNPDPRRRRR